MLQLIYELRKNCCGRTEGKIEGSTRGPRGPKKSVFYLGRQQVQFVFRSLGEGKSEDLLELLSIGKWKTFQLFEDGNFISSASIIIAGESKEA